ncbi:MAG: sigma 54-interacting transcriptional regulator [Desulfurivibrionaceae bacterium]
MTTEQQLADLTCLYEITKALASSLNLSESLATSMDILSRFKEMNNCTVTIVNPVTGQLEIEVAEGMTDEAQKRGKYKVGEGVTGRVVATGEPLVVPRVSEEPLFLDRTRSRSELDKKSLSFICVPVKHGYDTIGALSVDREYREGMDLDNDLQFLTVVSGLVAQTVIKVQEINEERNQLLRENTQLRRELTGKYQFENIISNSSRMQEVFEMMHRVADSTATVLLRGESGTGKTLVAKALHYNSKRATKPFVAVNCAALPETLLESELFGHEKGAFTGASDRKHGRFEQAEEGSLFLDEIGDLSPSVQIKLLNVVQEREFQRLGGVEPIKCNVRLIAATNKDLEEAVAAGTFREDLYYRLNVFPIYLPSLRDRRTDILLLAEYFLQKYCRENGKNIKRITTPAIDMLMQYHWPGNVRELENCMERAVLMCDEEAIKSYHLPPTLQTPDVQDDQSLTFAAQVERFEKELIVDALKRCNGNQTKAAAYLGSSLRIINYKINKYGIEARQFSTAS